MTSGCTFRWPTWHLVLACSGRSVRNLCFGEGLAGMAVSTLGLENAGGYARKSGVCLDGRKA
jgi:hypothetical protein